MFQTFFSYSIVFLPLSVIFPLAICAPSGNHCRDGVSPLVSGLQLPDSKPHGHPATARPPLLPWSFNVPLSPKSKAEQAREKLAFRGLLNCTTLMSTHSATTAFVVIWLDKGHLISECAWSELLRLQRNTSRTVDDRVAPTTEQFSHKGVRFSFVFRGSASYLCPQ